MVANQTDLPASTEREPVAWLGAQVLGTKSQHTGWGREQAQCDRQLTDREGSPGTLQLTVKEVATTGGWG